MEHFCCRLCVRACACVWLWNVDFLSLSSLMQLCFLPYASPICFLSSLRFPITSSLFLLNKGKHAISHNGIFSSGVCPWVGKNSSPLCLCVCVWGMRHSGGLRPEMGWVLLSSLNYLAHGGVHVSEHQPWISQESAEQSAQFFMNACPLLLCFQSAGTLVSQPCCLNEPAVYGNEDVQMCL